VKHRALFWVAWTLVALPLLLSGRALVYDDHREPADLILANGTLPAADDCWECHQPPLYYLLQAGTYALFGATSPSSQLRVQKLLTFLLCVGIWIVACFASARMFIGARERALALLGFLSFPAVFLLHLTLSNDVLAVLAGGMILVTLWRFVDPGRRRPGVLAWALLGGLFGLALLSKMTTLGLGPAILAGLLLAGGDREDAAEPGEVPSERVAPAFLGRLLASSLGLILVLGPWIAWNLATSGRPLPLRMQQQHYEPAPQGYFTSFRLGALLTEPFETAGGQGIRQRLDAPNAVDTSMATRAYSLFFNESLGYLRPVPPWLAAALYVAGLFLTGLTLVGAWRVLRPPRGRPRDAAGLIALVAAGSGLAFLVAFNVAYPSWKLVHAKAIFVMPVFPAIAWLYAQGLVACRDSSVRPLRHVVYSGHLIAQALFIAHALVIIMENGL
jgi:hypothetical protein